MKNKKWIIAALLLLGVAMPSYAQVVRKSDKKDKKEESTAGVTFRMKEFYEAKPVSDADMMWMRVIYRQLDLTKEANLPLYFPEEPRSEERRVGKECRSRWSPYH